MVWTVRCRSRCDPSGVARGRSRCDLAEPLDAARFRGASSPQKCVFATHAPHQAQVGGGEVGHGDDRADGGQHERGVGIEIPAHTEHHRDTVLRASDVPVRKGGHQRPVRLADGGRPVVAAIEVRVRPVEQSAQRVHRRSKIPLVLSHLNTRRGDVQSRDRGELD